MMSSPDSLPVGPESQVRQLTMVEALREALREEMLRDERVVLLGEDIGVEGGFGGAFTVTLGLSEEFGHRRVMDTPISEAAIAGVAIGAALGGLRPVADVQYGDFLFLAMDQLATTPRSFAICQGAGSLFPWSFALPLVLRLAGPSTGSRWRRSSCTCRA
jgi:pyruvate/2-oxoglutarate/acetoin dehydrogenase E1 component